MVGFSITKKGFRLLNHLRLLEQTWRKLDLHQRSSGYEPDEILLLYSALLYRVLITVIGMTGFEPAT